MKHLSVLFLVLLFIVACNKKTELQTPVETNKVYQVEDLNSDAFEYKAGSKITVEGLCIHVCKHSGKKMFIIGKSEKDELQVYTSKEIPEFDQKLNGSKLQLTGTLEEEKIDNNTIAEMEAELSKESSENKASCPTEDNLKEITSLKDRISKSKKGYISIYTLICTAVKTI